MFSHKSTPNFSTAESGASSREPFRKRLSSAFQMLVHGERPPQSPQPPLDPRIVAGINHHADFIAETYDDPLAGSFARDILTESAYVIVDSCGIPTEETVSDAADSEVTADLLTQSRREPR
jgi:hypothetical protein